MFLYNTIHGEKEEFIPGEINHVKMYVCGVTVYDRCHIGHARGAVFFDVLRKYFLWKGYRVTYIRNITDVDDKIIKRANDENKSPSMIAEIYTKSYYEDMSRLGVDRASIEPKATDHISDIITLTKNLIDKGYAYQVDGDVYFSVDKYPHYGQLSGKRLDDLMAGKRVAVDERKKNPFDFALWKSAKPDEPSWDSPFGKGRPGWHIECSAMSMKYLGESFDIHGGGSDLIFPHHENEMAESGAVSNKPLARFWIHNGFITWNDEKMSKSLGNVLSINEILDKFSPDALRYFLLSTHYRHPLEYSETNIKHSENAMKRIYHLVERLKREKINLTSDEVISYSSDDETISEFVKSMEDDMNTPFAIGVIFTRLNRLNTELDQNNLKNVVASAKVVLGLLKLLGFKLKIDKYPTDIIDKSWVLDMINKRTDARKIHDFRTADQIRDELLEKGVILEDTTKGTFYKLSQ